MSQAGTANTGAGRWLKETGWMAMKSQAGPIGTRSGRNGGSGWTAGSRPTSPAGRGPRRAEAAVAFPTGDGRPAGASAPTGTGCRGIGSQPRSHPGSGPPGPEPQPGTGTRPGPGPQPGTGPPGPGPGVDPQPTGSQAGTSGTGAVAGAEAGVDQGDDGPVAWAGTRGTPAPTGPAGCSATTFADAFGEATPRGQRLATQPCTGRSSRNQE